MLSWPEMVALWKKYSTPLTSDAVVAVILIELELAAAGTEDHVIGFGVGGVVSPPPPLLMPGDINGINIG
jgi:hypothetical protein